MKIGIIGAGNVARHLGALFLRSGHDVALGQRFDAKPEPDASYRSMSLEQVVAHGNVIVLAVPFGALTSVLPPLARALAGKVVVDATNPVQATGRRRSFERRAPQGRRSRASCRKRAWSRPSTPCSPT